MNKKSIARNSLAQIIMILTSVMIIFPLYFMTINSFKTREQYLVDPVGLPNPFTLQNYVDAFAGKDFLLWFANSLILSLGRCCTDDDCRPLCRVRLCQDEV